MKYNNEGKKERKKEWKRQNDECKSISMLYDDLLYRLQIVNDTINT